jgi:hypothetical protein
MKLKIWSEEEAKNSSEDQLFLRLENFKKRENDIILIVVDRYGKEIEDGTLLVIDQDFKIIVIPENLNEKIPLKSNVVGNVLTYTSQEMSNLRRERIREIMPNMSDLIIDKIKSESSD